MSRFALGTVLSLLLLSFAAQVRADIKIGFIDSEKIFANYKGTSQAQTEFNNDVQKWQQDVDGRRRELEKMTSEYQSQSLILSDAKKREMEEDLQQKRSDLDAFVQEIWGTNGKIAQRNEQLTRPIVEKIREILSDLARTQGISLVLDATDGNVVYADRALDLTDEVLTRLNQMAPLPTPPPATPKQNE
jgi:outer membrane protein